jgi:hypothetical protein
MGLRKDAKLCYLNEKKTTKKMENHVRFRKPPVQEMNDPPCRRSRGHVVESLENRNGADFQSSQRASIDYLDRTLEASINKYRPDVLRNQEMPVFYKHDNNSWYV